MRIAGSVLIAFVLVLTSCEDDTFLDRTVLDKIVFHENVDQVGTYQYHSNGLLKKYLYTFNGSEVEYTDYHYNGEKLASRTIYQVDNNGEFDLVRTDVFTYHTDGNLSEMTNSYFGTTEDTYSFSWQNKNVIRIDRTSVSSMGVQKDFYELEYDNQGNVSKAFFYDNNGEVPELGFILEYEYDDKVNPQRDAHEPVIHELRSVNNAIKIIQRQDRDSEPYAVTTRAYTYNSLDLPTEKKEVITLYGSVYEKINKYFYKKI